MFVFAEIYAFVRQVALLRNLGLMTDLGGSSISMLVSETPGRMVNDEWIDLEKLFRHDDVSLEYSLRL